MQPKMSSPPKSSKIGSGLAARSLQSTKGTATMDRKTDPGTHLPAPSAHPEADCSRKTGEAGRTGKNRGRKTGDTPAVFPCTALLLCRLWPQVLPLPAVFQDFSRIFKDSGDVHGLQSFLWTTMDDLSGSGDNEDMKKGITDTLRA